MRRSNLHPIPVSLAAALLTLAGSAHASSDAAWAEHDRAVVEQCRNASQFPDAAPAGDPILFDDEVGMTALLIQGHYPRNDGPQKDGPQNNGPRNDGPQNDMNGEAGQELCLFLRGSQEVYMADADRLAIGSDALPSTPTDAIDEGADTQEAEHAPSTPNGGTP